MAWNLLDSFMVALGFHVEHEGIEEFEHQTGIMKSAAIRLGTVLTAAAAGVGIFVHEIAEGMGHIQDFAELNQISAKSLDAMRYAGIEFDVNQDEMISGLTELNRKLGEAASGIGRGAMLFKKLGLEAHDSSGHVHTLWEMLEIIADRMSKHSRAENIALAERLGMSPMMVKMLELGAEKVRALREEAEKLIPFSDEDYETADKTAKAFERLSWVMGLFAKQIAVKLMPTVLSAIKGFEEWWKKLREDTASRLNQTLEILGKTISTLWTWVVRILSTIYSGIAWVFKFQLAFDALAATVSFLVANKLYMWIAGVTEAIKDATKAMMAFDLATIEIQWIPILITAIVVALGLLIDDLYELQHGGQSVIGDMLKKWDWFRDAVHIVGDALKVLGTVFLGLWDTLQEPLRMLKQAFFDVWEVVGPILGPILRKVLGADLKALLFALIAFVTILAFNLRVVAWGLENIARLLRFIFGLAKAGRDAIKGMFDGVMNLPGVKPILHAMSIATTTVAKGAATGAEKGTEAASKWAGTVTTGVLGKASDLYQNTKQSVQHITQKWEVPLQILTSDPSEAGRNVHEHLDNVYREAVRNGQSAVGL
jgi:hypothetical protein